MISGKNSRRLIELAFIHTSAESEQQAAQSQAEAMTLSIAPTTITVWLELVEYIKAWNNNPKHQEPMGRASALQFFLTRQAELEEAPASTFEQKD